MASRTWNRAAAGALAAVLALSVPAAVAAGEREPAGRARRQGTRTPSSLVTGLIGQAWSLLTSVWGKDGVLIDPDGAPVARDYMRSGRYGDFSAGPTRPIQGPLP